jgi:hypothetical protein
MTKDDSKAHEMTALEVSITKVGWMWQLLQRSSKLNWSRRQRPPRRLNEEAAMDEGGNPLARLVTEIGRAAQAGWAATARLTTLLAAAAGIVVMILVVIR